MIRSKCRDKKIVWKSCSWTNLRMYASWVRSYHREKYAKNHQTSINLLSQFRRQILATSTGPKTLLPPLVMPKITKAKIKVPQASVSKAPSTDLGRKVRSQGCDLQNKHSFLFGQFEYFKSLRCLERLSTLDKIADWLSCRWRTQALQLRTV